MPQLNPEAVRAVSQILQSRIAKIRLSNNEREVALCNLMCNVSAHTSPEDVRLALDLLTNHVIDAANSKLDELNGGGKRH